MIEKIKAVYTQTWYINLYITLFIAYSYSKADFANTSTIIKTTMLVCITYMTIITIGGFYYKFINKPLDD